VTRRLVLVTQRVAIPDDWRWRFPALTLGEAACKWLILRREELERKGREM
jgi:hypothetical protein